LRLTNELSPSVPHCRDVTEQPIVSVVKRNNTTLLICLMIFKLPWSLTFEGMVSEIPDVVFFFFLDPRGGPLRSAGVLRDPAQRVGPPLKVFFRASLEFPAFGRFFLARWCHLASSVSSRNGTILLPVEQEPPQAAQEPFQAHLWVHPLFQ